MFRASARPLALQGAWLGAPKDAGINPSLCVAPAPSLWLWARGPGGLCSRCFADPVEPSEDGGGLADPELVPDTLKQVLAAMPTASWTPGLSSEQSLLL